MTFGAALALLGLFAWFYLAFFHGDFWKPLLPAFALPPESWPSVDIIVPARDETEALPRSLPALLAQDYPGAWRIVLVDDHSTDGTGALARKIAEQKAGRLTVIEAPDLPPGWSGKLAALQAGLAQSTADYVLFTDADIRHPPENMRTLAARAVTGNLDLISQMASLHCESFAEKLLIPAFVFFFAALYPFRRANDPISRTAAAAGGVMLVRRAALDKIGGLAAIKSELIDDCALAREIKRSHGRIELTLAPDVDSLRTYPHIADVWHMIARTAYTQLNHSPLYLAGTITGMILLFLLPVLLPVFGGLLAAEAGLATWLVMTVIYRPMVRFYALPFVWAIMLPAAAVIYMAATVNSARLYWQGKGGEWKGRIGPVR